MPWLVSIDDWLASYRITDKIKLDPISTEERLRQVFAVYDCNGTEFSYVIFTEQQNFTAAEWRNGNRIVKTWQRCLLTPCSLSFVPNCKAGGFWMTPISRLTARYLGDFVVYNEYHWVSVYTLGYIGI